MLKLTLQLIPIGAAGCILGSSVPYGWKVFLAISSMWDVGLCGRIRGADDFCPRNGTQPGTSLIMSGPVGEIITCLSDMNHLDFAH